MTSESSTMKAVIRILAAVMIGALVSCEGLTLTVSPDGKISGQYQIPPKGITIEK